MFRGTPCIRQLNSLWKKTFKTIHQLSCFVGHPVFIEEDILKYSLTVMFRGTSRILHLGLRPEYSNIEESDFKPLCSARNSLNHCAVNRRGEDFGQAYHIN